MMSKKDEIKHLQQLHREYKKKYNSRNQTINEENKTVSSNITLSNLNNINNEESKNNYLPTKSEKDLKNSSYNENMPNNISNMVQNTNTNNSISEHIICEEERNHKISSRKAIPMLKINFPTEKKIINDEEDNNNNMYISNTIKNNDDINTNNNNISSSNFNDITFHAKPDIKNKSIKDDLICDSKIKNKKLNEYSMFLDEKINDLKKRLNLNNISSQELIKMSTLDNRGNNNFNNFFSGVNNTNLNSINAENKGNSNMNSSSNFYKNNMNMNMETYDFNSINMDQQSIGQTLLINNNIINHNTISVKEQNIRNTFVDKNVNLSFDKFLSLNNVSLKLNPYIIILSYLNTKDIFQIFHSNKKLRELFIKALKLELNIYIINKFKHITKNLFDNHSFYIELNKSLKSKELKIFLILKAKIICRNLIKKSVHLQYFAHFPCDFNQYVQNTYVFDVKMPPIYYWAMKESTNFNEDELNKAYFMNVMQYAINDYAEFTVNIFTDKGLMDIRKLVWDKITVFKTPNENFLDYSNENILKREIVDFDVSRYCEMELCKGKWNDIILLENSESIIGPLVNKFKNNFNILKILFDNVGYYIFKFYLEGKKEGEIKDDEEIGIKLTVLSPLADKYNETKKNNLIFDRKNEIQLHLGDIFIFYISKNI